MKTRISESLKMHQHFYYNGILYEIIRIGLIGVTARDVVTKELHVILYGIFVNTIDNL